MACENSVQLKSLESILHHGLGSLRGIALSPMTHPNPVAEFGPTMIGGAADLVESTKTVFEGGGEFSGVHAGRNVPFGIREHAMGAILNGLSLSQLRPYGSGFLIFIDYARPAIPWG